MIVDINNDPVLTNLPDTINVLENLPLATSVYQAFANDTDSSDPKVFRASFDKEWAAQYFTVDNISTLSLLQVRTLSRLMLKFTVFHMFIALYHLSKYRLGLTVSRVANFRAA